MNSNTNTNLAYGNPNLTQKTIIEKQSILDILFSDFENSPFPSNESQVTKNELNEISKYINTIQIPANKNLLDNYLMLDRNFRQSIVNTFKEHNIDIEDLVNNISDDIQPLLLRLKYYYNRPRPFQLAAAYNLKLFPFESKTAGSPSYPSGHTLLGKVALTVIGIKYPDYEELCDNLINITSYSRIYLGHHYQSDNDFAIEIADAILKNKKFCLKYNL